MLIIDLFHFCRCLVNILKRCYKRMYSILTNKKLMYGKQYGFRSNYSTNHVLISLETYRDSGHFVPHLYRSGEGFR